MDDSTYSVLEGNSWYKKRQKRRKRMLREFKALKALDGLGAYLSKWEKLRYKSFRDGTYRLPDRHELLVLAWEKERQEEEERLRKKARKYRKLRRAAKKKGMDFEEYMVQRYALLQKQKQKQG